MQAVTFRLSGGRRESLTTGPVAEVARLRAAGGTRILRIRLPEGLARVIVEACALLRAPIAPFDPSPSEGLSVSGDQRRQPRVSDVGQAWLNGPKW